MKKDERTVESIGIKEVLSEEQAEKITQCYVAVLNGDV